MALVSHHELEMGCYSLDFNDDKLYVGLRDSGMVIVDVSDPTHPQTVGWFEEHCTGYGIRYYDDHVYLCCGTVVRILDVSDACNPVEVGVFEPPEFLGPPTTDVAISGNTMFVASGNLWVADISDKSAPELITSYNNEYVTRALALNENLLYLADKSNIQPPVYSSLTVLDIGDPTIPVEISSYVVAGNVFDVTFDSNYVYVCAGLSGLAIFDVSNPLAPMPVGCLRTPGFILGFSKQGHLAILTQRRDAPGIGDDYGVDICNPDSQIGNQDVLWSSIDSGSVLAVDLSEKTSPQLISSEPDYGIHIGIKVFDGLGFVADEFNGLKIIDLTDFSVLSHIPMMGLSEIKLGIAKRGNLLFVTNPLTGLHIFDISNLSKPEELGSYDTPGWAGNVALSGGYAFIADGQSGVVVLDISNPSHPDYIGAYDTPDWAVEILVDGSFAYISDRYGGLLILNIENPQEPVLASHYPGPGEQSWIIYLTKQAGLLACGSAASVLLFDVSDPLAPQKLGEYYPGGWDQIRDIGLFDNFLFLAEERFGIRIIDISDPTVPVFADRINTSGISFDVTFDSTNCYVADAFSLIRLTLDIATDVDNDGGSGQLPKDFELFQNYPNPFNPTTTIQFDLPRRGNITLDILNILGQRVRRLANETVSAGSFKVEWDGTDDLGRPVASGVYLYRLTTGDATLTKKMIILK